MPHTFLLGLRGYISALVGLIEACAWSDPGCLSRVVINVVCSAQVILAALPAVWQPSLSVLECTVCAAGTIASWTSTIWRRPRSGGRTSSRRTCWGWALGRRLASDCWSLLAGVCVGRMQVRCRLLRGGHNAWDATIYGRMRGCGWTGGVLSSLTDGRREVSGEVKDELAVDDHVVI